MTTMLPAPSFSLSTGKHSLPQQGMCLMECVAFIAGEPHSDAPQCASPVVAELARVINDSAFDEGRQMLLRRILQIATSRGTPEQEHARFGRLTDFVVREHLVALFNDASLPDFATQVLLLAPLCQPEGRAAAVPVLQALVRQFNTVFAGHKLPLGGPVSAAAAGLGHSLGALSLSTKPGHLPEAASRIVYAMSALSFEDRLAVLDALLLMGEPAPDAEIHDRRLVTRFLALGDVATLSPMAA